VPFFAIDVLTVLTPHFPIPPFSISSWRRRRRRRRRRRLIRL
jgi:hypothetical protein